ncbi:unnamed protein product [Leuciscus chuanchicus]
MVPHHSLQPLLPGSLTALKHSFREFIVPSAPRRMVYRYWLAMVVTVGLTQSVKAPGDESVITAMPQESSQRQSCWEGEIYIGTSQHGLGDDNHVRLLQTEGFPERCVKGTGRQLCQGQMLRGTGVWSLVFRWISMFMIGGPHRLQMQLPRLTTSNRQTADNELKGERRRGRQG